MEHTPNGILLVDKAEGWTSHDAVAKARRALGTRKVGHAGTLDPMATGLLLLGAGPATRLLTHLVGLDKAYAATIRLGLATATDDREGEPLEVGAAELREREERIAALAADPAPIRAAIAGLTGPIEQAPSAVSAIKVGGRRAYDLVRSGERVELKKRPVTIHGFEIGEPRPAVAVGAGGAGGDAPRPVIDLDATIRCSSGTYVRALARDLGAALGVGGHLIALRRTEVGPFSARDAVSTPALVVAADGSGAPVIPALLDPAAVASRLFPVLALTAAQAVDLGHGKRLELGEGQRLFAAERADGADAGKDVGIDAGIDAGLDASLAAAIAPEGRLVGLVEVKRGRARVVTNFPQPPVRGEAETR